MSPPVLNAARSLAGYEIQERLGAGGYGEVWKAEAPGGLPKAIKFIYGHLDERRAACEMKALERIKEVRHPFLLSLERIEVVDDQLVIVTELADRSLKDRYEECKASGQRGIPRDELLAYLRDAADALDYIRQHHSLQHLDVKPENLLVVGNHVKVADFGLVKDIQDASVSLVGGLTPVYAPPEVFDGHPSLHSDQYSLAIVYQEMLTGTLPFSGKTPVQLAAQRRDGQPRLGTLPSADRPVIARALVNEPERRFAGCRVLVEQLSQADRADTAARPVVAIPNIDAAANGGPDTATLSAEATDAEPPAVDKTLVINPGAFRPAPRPARSSAPRATRGSFSTATAETVHLPPIELPNDRIGIRPTLIVGVGGVAARAVALLHRRIGEQFPELEAIPALRTVLIDTDPLSAIRASETGGTTSVSDADILHVRLRKNEHYRQQSKDLLRWISRRWLYNIPKSLKTEGLRPLGRLAFVDHAAAIMQGLTSQLEAVTDDGALETTARALGLGVSDTSPRVLIVGSICGGTGGGMILDLGYALRTILRQKGLSEEGLCGILTHATVRHSCQDLAVANALACLSEFHHYGFSGSYPGDPACGLPPFEPGVGPFHDTYLFHMGDQLDEAGFESGVDTLADYLYLNAVTPAGAFLDQARREGRRRLPTATPTVRTFGAVRLGDAPDWFVSAAAELLVRDVVRRWQSAGDKDGQSCPPSNAAAGADQTIALPASLEDLLGQARQFVESELEDSVEVYFQSRVDRWLGDSPQNAPAEQKLLASRILKAVDAELQEEPDSTGCRLPGLSFEGILQTRFERLAAQHGANISHWVFHLTGGDSIQLSATRQAADRLTQQLRTLESEADDRLQQTMSELQRFKHGLPDGDDRPARSRGWLSFGKSGKQEAGGVLGWTEYALLRLDQLALREIAKLLRSLRARATALGDRLAELQRDMNRLDEIFHPRWSWTDLMEESRQARDPLQGLLAHRIEVLRGRLDELASEVDGRIRNEYFRGVGGLEGVIDKEIHLDATLPSILRQIAQRTVLAAWHKVDVVSYLTTAHENPQEALQACLQAAEPRLADCGGAKRLLLVTSRHDADKSLAAIFRKDLDQPTTEAHDTATGTVLCREMEGLPLEAVAVALSESRGDCAEAASRLHTRVDVRWQPFGAID